MPKRNTKYRQDIQVLRGIAVLSVVLFHVRENLFSLGYLGVDIFFVISGFVVTPLIIRIFDNQTSFKGILENLFVFYRRRFYRLAPALGAMLAISAIAIFFIGNLYDHSRFARQGIATLLLFGNIGAFKNSGNYFSPNPNPLIHTWSLSVEEQIYFILPLVIIFVFRKQYHMAKKIFTTLLIILIISLSLFISPQLLNFLYTGIGVNDASIMNFYSPISRIWQFCLGGVIYYITQKRLGESQRTILSVQIILSALLLFLFLPHFQIDTRVSSIIASAISGIIIYYRGLAVLPKHISNTLKWCGDRSYSIYLVHMPLIYIAKYSPLHFFDSYRKYATGLAVILSLYLGHLCFRRVEEKYRITTDSAIQKRYRLRNLVLIFMLFPGILFTSVAVASNHNYDSHQVYLKGCVDTGFDPVACLWKSELNKGLIMVVGDSQSYANADGVISASNSLGFNVIASSISGCPFLDVQTSGGDSKICKTWQDEVMHFIVINKPDVVVITNRTNGYINPASGWRVFLDSAAVPVSSRTTALTIYQESIKRILGNVTKSGSKVILFQNIPEPIKVGTNSILTKLLNQGRTVQLPLSSLSVDNEVIELEQNIAKNFSTVRLLNPTPVLCPNNVCAIVEQGRDVYRDIWHLSEYGSLKLTPAIGESITRVINQ